MKLGSGYTRLRRSLLAVVAAVCGLLAGPAGALAANATVTFDGTNVTFTAGAETVNAVTYTANTTGVTITDTAALIQAPGCTGNGTNTVTCTPLAPKVIESVTVDLGNLNDSGIGNGSLGAALGGSEGDDTLIGSDTNGEDETMVGGDGSDSVNTRNVGIPIDPLGFGYTIGDRAVGDDFGDNPAGDGNDTIVTGTGSDSADGGAGVDTISTGAGDDTAFGGAGDGDRVDLGDGDDFTFLSAGPDDGGADVLQGGPGLDELDYEGATEFNPPAMVVLDALTVDLTAGTANKPNNTPEGNTAAGFEDLDTSGRDSTDIVNGSAGSNSISTGFGNDVVNPQAGADTVGLGRQDDSADTRDGSPDRVFCGPGADKVAADQFDEVSTTCETVTRTPVRPAGADLAAPVCKVRKVKRRKKG